MNKTWKIIGTILLSISTTQASAIIVSHGNLNTNDTTNYITDTNTGRLYTRFDAFDLTYSVTLLAIAQGGLFEGWSIATSLESEEFTTALLGNSTSQCVVTTITGTFCGTVTNWNDGDLGHSFQQSWDYFAFTNLIGGAGIIEITDSGEVRESEYFLSLDGIDSFNVRNNTSINYLLYNDNGLKLVHEPTSLNLFVLGLMCLVFRRFKTKFI